MIADDNDDGGDDDDDVEDDNDRVYFLYRTCFNLLVIQ